MEVHHEAETCKKDGKGDTMGKDAKLRLYIAARTRQKKGTADTAGSTAV